MRAPGLTGLAEARPQNSWEWYFLMQHSCAPTRLLDWTEGALLALYFALKDSKNGKDASVWVLDPWWLNERVLKEREVIPPGATAGIWRPDADRYYPWLPNRYDRNATLPDEPVAVYPSHIARRISTQRSCFTVHGSDPEGLEKLGSEENARLVNIFVSGSAAHTIQEELAVYGVDEVTIFPDLDGLGRSLSTMLEGEATGLKIEFRNAVLPDELDDLTKIDRKIFASFPDDLFDAEEWNTFESYWMLVNGTKVGCSVFKSNVDYDDQPRLGCLYLVSTGILPEFQSKGFGKKLKAWQIKYARENGFSLITTNMRHSNARMICLNLGIGFKIRGVDAGYYHAPDESAVIMDLPLNS
jgi:GNAT superfamily N-acetyltransferase